MTGYRSKHFRHRCPEKGCYVEQLPSWDDFIDCFPRGIRPTDIDGMVEIGDSFLFLEEKSPGKSLEYGQHSAMKLLSKRERITVVSFRPILARPTDLECLVYSEGVSGGWRPCTREAFKDSLRAWSAKADQRRREAS